MRQGRVFSPSAAKTELKCTSRTPNESSRTRNESLHGRRTQSELTHTLFSCRFQREGYRERSSNRRPKVHDGNNKNAKKTRKYQRNIRVWTRNKPRCRKMTMTFPVFERNVNTHKMFCCHFSTRTNFKIYWRQQQKREEHSGIQKEYLSVNTSRVLGWRWQTFPGL